MFVLLCAKFCVVWCCTLCMSCMLAVYILLEVWCVCMWCVSSTYLSVWCMCRLQFVVAMAEVVPQLVKDLVAQQVQDQSHFLSTS